jgi:hypothetical protein
MPRPARRRSVALSARSEPETVAQVVQHLGDAAHARAADADEVDVADGVLHAASSSHAATISRVAVSFCMFWPSARAATARRAPFL